MDEDNEVLLFKALDYAMHAFLFRELNRLGRIELTPEDFDAYEQSKAAGAGFELSASGRGDGVILTAREGRSH